MTGNFTIVDQSVKNLNDTWIPVVKSKHSEIVKRSILSEVDLFVDDYDPLTLSG
jgi:hypothetical protein